MTTEFISQNAGYILLYIIVVISPSMFIGRLVSWYLWRKNVVYAKKIIGDYDTYQVAILLVVFLKLSSNTPLLSSKINEINPPILIFIISFFIPILITRYFIKRKNKYVISKCFKLKLSIISLKILIIIAYIPIITLYVCMILRNYKNQDMWEIIILYPIMIFIFSCDLLEISSKTIKFLKESVKFQHSRIYFYQKRKERMIYTKRDDHISENGKFKSLTDILVDEHDWNPIFIDYQNKNNTVSIRWDFKNKGFDNNEMIGPFFVPPYNLLTILSESGFKSEKNLPKTKLENILKRGREIKFNVGVLISKKDSQRSSVSWSLDIKNSFLQTFYNNFQGTFTIVQSNQKLSDTYNTLDGIRLVDDSRNFLIKDQNGTFYTLSYDLLYERELVYLSVKN